MLAPVLALVLGLVVLVFSADRFVDGASSFARYCGVSSFLVGMLVVGFGTSAPEIAVSVFSALGGVADLAIGNAYGSNIMNIALILGLTAVLAVIPFPRQVVFRDLPALVAVTLVSFALFFDGTLSRPDGALLLIMFCAIIGCQIWSGLRHRAEEDKPEGISLGRAVFWLLLGLVLLVASSRLLVYGASEIARALGVSDLLIGLTVVAIGTSLPELASSVAAARKHDTALALGNVIGSNLFNTLVVVGIPSVIRPMQMDPLVSVRDFPVMLLLTLFLFPFGARGRLGRAGGAFLLLCFALYLSYLIFTAVKVG